MQIRIASRFEQRLRRLGREMARAVLLQTTTFGLVVIIIVVIFISIIMSNTFKARSMTRLVRLRESTSEEEEARETTSRAVWGWEEVAMCGKVNF